MTKLIVALLAASIAFCYWASFDGDTFGIALSYAITGLLVLWLLVHISVDDVDADEYIIKIEF